jgi:5'-methylthioadenosine phosphorylase
LIDFTRNRTYSFFGNGLVAHVSLADPFCPILSQKLIQAARKTGATVHDTATYITIEGPRFSTRAESKLFRQWGIDIIGMTAIPEATLAREAEMCYAMMAHVTDYDCWHETEAAVSVEMLIENLMANAEISKQAIENLIPGIEDQRPCSCSQALATSIITQHNLINQETKSKLKPLIHKYIK